MPWLNRLDNDDRRTSRSARLEVAMRLRGVRANSRRQANSLKAVARRRYGLVFGVVVVEPAPRLSAQPSVCEVFAQELARAFRDSLSLDGVLLLDVQHDVEPDHVH